MTLLEQLKDLRDNGPDDHMSGICIGVSQEPGIQERLKQVMDTWPERSGNLMFPVPHPDFGSAQMAYYETPTDEMWDSTVPYGAARLRLLDHCIKTLEAED